MTNCYTNSRYFTSLYFLCVCVCLCVCLVDSVVAGECEGLSEAYDRGVAMYKTSSCCDYCLRVVVTSWSEQVKQDMQLLVNDRGTTASHTRPQPQRHTLVHHDSITHSFTRTFLHAVIVLKTKLEYNINTTSCHIMVSASFECKHVNLN